MSSFAVEAETAALRRELVRWPRRVSSLLAAVELTRVARRLGPHAGPLARRVLAGLDLMAIDRIFPPAMLIGSDGLRSLDAIHVATAACIAAELGALISYDPSDARRWPEHRPAGTVAAALMAA